MEDLTEDLIFYDFEIGKTIFCQLPDLLSGSSHLTAVAKFSEDVKFPEIMNNWYSSLNNIVMTTSQTETTVKYIDAFSDTGKKKKKRKLSSGSSFEQGFT
jgi:hypothetical protein